VVVRRIVGIRGNRPLFTDVLGELISYDDAGLAVATKSGVQNIPRDAIQAAKRVPYGPKQITELERIANETWPAPVQDRLGEWTLRAADGWTGRANSALPLGDPGLDREAAIDAVVDWYRRHGLPARINVPLPLGNALDAALTARGWTRSVPTLVLTARLPLAVEERADLPPVRLATEPDDAWLAVVAARKGGLPPAARHVLTAAPQVVFASVNLRLTGPAQVPAHDDGHRAVARGALAGGYLQVALLEVAPEARRQGLATHVTRALAQWGREHGGGTAFLQVESTNAAALALYGRLGFTVHHEYVTRTATA
jgi:ribosomal protein S18 acetylase RimI-like enzyme